MLALGAPGLGVAYMAPTWADVPDPTPGTAVVNVYVGGDRGTATTIDPLPAVTFGLFETEPQDYDPLNGYTTDDPLFTCESDADGDCSFEVPVGGSGVAAGSRLWVAPVDGPDGWYANPVWQTAPLTGTSGRVQTRHVFQTPQLFPGRSYFSGSGGFISDPGTETDPPSGIPQYTTRVASGGTWPLSRVDPDLPAQCGLKVALVVDLSSSVVGSVDDLKSTADAFVEALRGTPSQASLFTFSTDSPAVNAGPNSPMMPVATTADSTRFEQLYAGWTDRTANGYTNWDRALAAVAAVNENPNPDEHFDLAVFLTDGNPTSYGPQGADYPRPAGYTRFREIGNAVASANRLKSEGTRIVAVGVGAGLDEGAARNLRSISGRTEYDGTNIAVADYFQEETYSAVGDSLRDLVLSACAPSVSVIKQIVPFGGDVDDAYTPADGWEFTARTTTADATVSPTVATTDPHTGALNFDLSFDEAAAPAGLEVTEDPRTAEGYTPYPVEGQNAVCVNKSEDDDPVPVTNVGATGFHVDVGLQDALSCVVYNQAPDADAASVVVDKQWRVTTAVGTQVYAEGEQPVDLQSSLSLSGPGGAEDTGQPWSVPRDGYRTGDQLTISEEIAVGLPGCTFTGATIEGAGVTDPELPPDDPAIDVTVGAGANAYTVTNEVECHSHLTLLKQVVGGDAGPESWTLQAVPPAGALPGPEGPTGVTAEVTDGVAYQLAERLNSDDPSLLNYRQDDHRPDPSLHPASTGSMTCTVVGESAPRAGDAWGTDGSVVVPLGHDVECVATNQTARLTVLKEVVGGDAEPADFGFTVTPIDPDPEGVPAQSVPGAAAPGAEVFVRPGQEYRLTEDSSADDYQLTSLTCTAGDTTAPADTITIPAGADAVCTAVNTFHSWTVHKSSDPVSGSVVEPGDVITYTLTASQLEGGPTTDVTVTDDLSDVLDDAALVDGSIVPSSGTAAVDGDDLTWHLPELSGDQTLTYQVRVDDDAWDTTLSNVITEHTTGDGDDATPCEDVDGISPPEDCDSTTHTTPDEPSDDPTDEPTEEPTGDPTEEPTEEPTDDPDDDLPDTGGFPAWALPGVVLLFLAGAALRAGVGRVNAGPGTRSP